MYKLFILHLLIALSFLSCGKRQKNGEQKKENSFSPPVTVNASPPIITNLDTCPKPLVINITEKASNINIPTVDGSITITVPPPLFHPLINGEAGGFTFMQSFNTEQGLALNSVSCSITDKTGNLWFGTYGGGVSRYDGKSFTNFTTAQGLAGNLIKSIAQDKTGNLWFGTNGGGVSKYDGSKFTNYNKMQGLAGNLVFGIIEDKKGNLWFGTEGGVSRYNPAGIIKEGENIFINYTTEQGLVNNYVLSLLEDKSGNIWFGTDHGISRYDPSGKARTGSESFTNFTTAHGLTSNEVRSIIEDKSGNIWFGTSGGVSSYNPADKEKTGCCCFTNFTTSQGLAHNSIHTIAIDSDENIWFGTSSGLSRYNPLIKSFTNFTTAQGLINNEVYCITEDKTGNLWFGTGGFGLNKYDGKAFTIFGTDQGFNGSKVWCVTEDTTGNIWIGVGSGLSKYDGKSVSNIFISYITSNVRSIIKDKTGNLWFGSAFGAVEFDGKSMKTFAMVQGLLNKGVISIIQDSKGNFWFGTYGNGVYKYDGKSFTNYKTTQGLADNVIKCIAEDKNGNIWFGCNGNGISRFDPSAKSRTGSESFTNYNTAQGLAGNTVLSCLKDKAGNLWFGTSGGGVSRYDPASEQHPGSKSFINYTTTQGLANDVVYAIAEDTRNNILWFGTNSGLSGLKLNTLSSEDAAVQFENFNNNTGYPIRDINTGALFIDSKGIIWAGAGNTLVRFDYKAVHKNTEPPVIFIQALKIQGEKICWYDLIDDDSEKNAIVKSPNAPLTKPPVLNEEVITFGRTLTEAQRDDMRKKFSDVKFDSVRRFYPVPENLVLPFNHNNITFDFAAINPSRPRNVRYQYILEGYDNDWNAITDASAAVFGNIHEGTYTFKLKAQSPDGIWSEPITYTFKVLPPWYRTWWMYLTYLFIGLASIGLFFRWRTASLRKEKELLEQMVKIRTSEVVEQKELVEEKKELLEEKQKEIVDSINYAKRIQYTLLADDTVLQQNLKEYFVLLQPKDIVSGDFYWAVKIAANKQAADSEEKTERFYLAICDSTGHGVPGAFMSLLNITFLNEAITEKNIQQPDQILNYVRRRLIDSISQEGAQDGMDGILVCIEKKAFVNSHSSLESAAMASNDKSTTEQMTNDYSANEQMTITYAAANNAPVIVRDKAVIILPSDKMPIGKGEKETSFTLHTIDAQKDDLIYFYTDGYADQFGGPKGKKFKYKQLENLLISINLKSMEEQKQLLTAALAGWKGNLEQVDDILVIGMRIG